MKQRIICALAVIGFALSLGGCGSPTERPSSNVTPTEETPAPTPLPTPTPTPTPTPIPTLSPMERKYIDYDSNAADLKFEYLDESLGKAVSQKDAEAVLEDYLYGTWYWEGSDQKLVIDQETLDGKEYRVHAIRTDNTEAVAVSISYADAPEKRYQLNRNPAGSEPYFLMVSLKPDGGGEKWVAYQYSSAELEALYEEYEDDYGDDYGGSTSSVPDGTVAYFRFMYDVGQYVVENGQYVLKNKWTWSENNNCPPEQALFSICLPQTIPVFGCPYTSCSADVLDMDLSGAMFSSYDNLLNF